MSDVYKMFETDEQVEQEGVLLNYGKFRILIARAGGANRKFAKVFREKAKPFKYALDHNKMSEDDSNRVMAEVYAETVILGWESIVKNKETGEPELKANGEPKLQKKIEDKDGKLMEFSVENCVQLLMDLPELFRDIQQQASTMDAFQKEEEEEDSKNLSVS